MLQRVSIAAGMAAAAIMAALSGGWPGSVVWAQAPGPQAADMKIFEGVYTAAQAVRGKTVYEAYCTRCHGLDLNGGREGGQGAPPLNGNPFFVNWERSSLNNLLSKIERTMPQDSPASLRTDDYVDVATYILLKNAFPTGNAELKRDSDTTENIRIMRKAGSATEAPSFALVQVVGCLASADNSWLLTNTTEPIVTRDDALTPNEVKDSESRSLGAQTFRLIDAAHFNPAAHKGQKVAAKGILSRAPNENRIDLMSLQMVATTCGN